MTQTTKTVTETVVKTKKKKAKKNGAEKMEAARKFIGEQVVITGWETYKNVKATIRELAPQKSKFVFLVRAAGINHDLCLNRKDFIFVKEELNKKAVRVASPVKKLRKAANASWVIIRKSLKAGCTVTDGSIKDLVNAIAEFNKALASK